MGKHKSKKVQKRDILDKDTLQYYLRISHELKQDFDDDESKALMLQNIFRQLSSEAVKVSQSPTVSFIVEELVRLADRAQLTMLLEQLSVDWEVVCCHQFASHVTQAVVNRCGYFIHEAASVNAAAVTEKCKHDSHKSRKRKHRDDGEHTPPSECLRTGPSLSELFDSLCTFLHGSLSLYMQDVYASHVVRAVLQVLSAQHVDDAMIHGRRHGAKQPQQHQSKTDGKVLPVRASEVNISRLNEFAQRIVSLKKLSDHVSHVTSSPLLQTLLIASRSLTTDQRDVIFTQLADNARLFHVDDNQTLPSSVTHDISSYVVQQYITQCSVRLFDDVWQSCLCRHVIEMSRHKVANFVLQTVVTRVHTSQQAEAVFTALRGEFEQLFAVNHIGVLVQLADACHRLNTKQSAFIKSVMKAVHCYKPVDRRSHVVRLLASMCTYEILFTINETTRDSATEHSDADETAPLTEFNHHGSLLLQSMLRFSCPELIVESLLSLSGSELCAVCCDSAGSHVITAFINSPTITQQSQLYSRLQPVYSELTCNKWGSRAFDSLWDAATFEQRQMMVTSLRERVDALRSNQFGSFIYNRCALSCFMERPGDWKQLQMNDIGLRRLIDSSASVPLKSAKKNSKRS